MDGLQSTYTIRLNHRHQSFGHVFSGRYRSHLVEGSGTRHLRTACDYVHLNPVRAGMLKAGERLLSYPWSSFGAYLAAPEHRSGWIRVDRLLGEHGIQADTAAGREQFERWMERRIAARVGLGTSKRANANLHRYLRGEGRPLKGTARRSGRRK